MLQYLLCSILVVYRCRFVKKKRKKEKKRKEKVTGPKEIFLLTNFLRTSRNVNVNIIVLMYKIQAKFCYNANGSHDL